MRARSWIVGAFGLAMSCALVLGACSDDDTSAPIADTWPDANVQDAPFVPYDVGPFPDAGGPAPGCYQPDIQDFEILPGPVLVAHRNLCTHDEIVALRAACLDVDDGGDAATCDPTIDAHAACAGCLFDSDTSDAATDEWGAVFFTSDHVNVDTTGCLMASVGDDGGCTSAEILRHYCDDHSCEKCGGGAAEEACRAYAQNDPNGCALFAEFGVGADRCEAIYDAGASNPSIASACGLDAGSFDDAFDRVATVLCGP